MVVKKDPVRVAEAVQFHSRISQILGKEAMNGWRAACIKYSLTQHQIKPFHPAPNFIIEETEIRVTKWFILVSSYWRSFLCTETVKKPFEPLFKSRHTCCWNKVTGTGKKLESVCCDQGMRQLERISPSSNILDDIFKFLFRVHMELHPRLHCCKLQGQEERVIYAYVHKEVTV